MGLPRRALLAAATAGAALAGCGFRLRGQGLAFAFRSLRLQGVLDGDVAAALRAQLQASGVQVLQPRRAAAPAGAVAPVPDVVLEILQDQRERVVVGTTTAGQVRELLLRRRVRFALRTPDGRELIEPTELQQEREQSFAETVVLGKEAEEALLFDDMRTAIVRQLLVRLSRVQGL
ncbi:LPS-assembly lipoprotein LptE [Tepidimonas alkaliphilus]|uniref:LPS-assembly lipoprotein LptE n=1 Tax=Tepidimonas alkaliphilus TaxID=2588942 RepID=A0A554W767_9BURK|nr:LPS assembly lipoprotein LptE [Tepidimonas alkaliphilus]TSE19410.1 LPS-assembly lipoprotein LptE [Tepidimonas alkaliphilus]